MLWNSSPMRSSASIIVARATACILRDLGRGHGLPPIGRRSLLNFGEGLRPALSRQRRTIRQESGVRCRLWHAHADVRPANAAASPISATRPYTIFGEK